ncbi:MAG: hypothetical protein ACK5PF_08185, partial [bacterium]
YMTLTGHLFGGTAFILNARVWNGWPADVQQAVLEAAREATVYQRELAGAEDAFVLSQLDPAKNEVIVPTAHERHPYEQPSFSACQHTAAKPKATRWRRQAMKKSFFFLKCISHNLYFLVSFPCR